MFDVDSVNAEHQIYTVWHTNLQSQEDPKGGILILADTGVAFQGLLQATQRCFPKLDVKLSTRLPESGSDLPPRIVLIHAALFRHSAGIVGQCRERFPATPIGIMVDESWPDVPGLRALIGEKLVQGLLPLNLQINVWLATVWLLLNGGEYFPGSTSGRNSGDGYMSRLGYNGIESRPSEPGERGLSTRERQVLELMSEGLQNKIIAVKMDLSEHTVKVHVHNIIRKLKVHNRTQAAAVYRSFDRRPPFAQPDSPAAIG